MSTPKLFGSVIVSRTKAKTLMQIAEEMEASERASKESMTKSASKQDKKEVTASTKEIKVEKPKVQETKVKASTKEKTLKVSSSDEVKNEKVQEKEAGNKFNFTKIAKLTDKDRSYLKKYYEEYYPADYVDALLADY
jgi:hypothetical protein